MWRFAWVLMIGFASVSCNNSKKAGDGSSVASTAAAAKNEVVVSFKQTACYGSCPVHEMTIYTDGSAFYTAERNTKIVGKFTAKLTNKEVEAIIQEANNLRFFDTEKTYTGHITDLPTTTIFVRYGDKTHQVIAYYGYPDDVKEYIQFLYEITQSTAWKAID